MKSTKVSKCEWNRKKSFVKLERGLILFHCTKGGICSDSGLLETPLKNRIEGLNIVGFISN